MNEQRGQLAISVAALFLAACQEKASAPPAPAMTIEKASAGKVHCLGIHECKGKSACHVAGGHACAGQNEMTLRPARRTKIGRLCRLTANPAPVRSP